MSMVNDQIINRGIRDINVISAMFEVERSIFVTESEQMFAHEDYPLPIGYGQTISQPYIVAYMTEALSLEPDDRVLEIGTGSGYQTAILSKIAKEVFSIEKIPQLKQMAEENLGKANCKNIKLKASDGFFGWKEKAPFNKIIITAAAPSIPEPLLEQLDNDFGKMILPLGEKYSYQELILVTKKEGKISIQPLIPVRFVPFISKNFPNKK